MINLLPEQAKSELKLEQAQKKVLLVLVFILIFFIFLIFIFAALKFSVALRADSLDDLILAEEKELRSTHFQNFKAKVVEINQDLSKIHILYGEQILFVPILEKLSSLTPETIYFTDLSLKKNFVEVENKETGKKEKKVFAELLLDGSTQSRATLFSFKKSLETEETFEEIYFAPSSWVKPTDIDFSLNLRFVP